MTDPGGAAADGLTNDEIRHFVEKGFVWLRGCFSPETARAVVASVFEPGGSLLRCSTRTIRGDEPFEYSGQPLTDCRAWRTERVDVETGYRTTFERLSPRLHRAIQQLIGNADSMRSTLGEQWILNVDYEPSPPDRNALEHEWRRAFWHIDDPRRDTTLVEQWDALLLLVLWSDVEEHGGGTLFAPDSLDRVVEELATSPDPVDTTDEEFGKRIMARCHDLREQVGKAGDVLVIHGLMLHARPRNHRLDVRILENPTIRVRRALDYRRDNPNPSPVEECIIRRLQQIPNVRGPLAAREEESRLEDAVRHRLVEAFPSHFFPYVKGNPERRTAYVQGIEEADRFLFECWVRREAKSLARHHPTALSAAWAAVRRVRSLIVTQRDLHGLETRETFHESGSLQNRAYAMLTLGFANCEGLSYVVGRLLRAMGHEVWVYETDRTFGNDRHVLLLLASEGAGAFVDPWSDVNVFWVDGWDRARAAVDWQRNGLPLPNVRGPMPGVRSYEEPGREADGRWRGAFPRQAYLRGRLHHPSWLDGDDPADLRDAVLAFCRSEARAAGEAPDVWRAFLRLRIRQLEGALPSPDREYEALLRDPALKGSTRRLVQVLKELARPHGADGVAMSPEGGASHDEKGELTSDEAALAELCEALGIPPRGSELGRNVIVGARQGGMLELHVGGPHVAPLRIHVSAPRPGRKAFFSDDRFAITYSTAHGGLPSYQEQRFLAWLKARVAALRGGAQGRHAVRTDVTGEGDEELGARVAPVLRGPSRPSSSSRSGEGAA